MALPYATRCAMQALRESSDERAQNAYASLVQAFVSGDPEDVKIAEESMSQLRSVPLSKIAKMPSQCQSEMFRPLHNAAINTANSCGVALPDDVLSEQRSAEFKTSVSYLAAVVVLVLLCVLVHAWIQRCKPSQMCRVRH